MSRKPFEDRLKDRKDVVGAITTSLLLQTENVLVVPTERLKGMQKCWANVFMISSLKNVCRWNLLSGFQMTLRITGLFAE